MSQKLTRREFGQLAIAGTAVAGVAALASKTLAQTPNLEIVGVKPGSVTSPNATASVITNTTDINIADVLRTAVPRSSRNLLVQSLNVGTSQIQNLPISQVLQGSNTPIIQSGEQVTGLTSLTDGTLVVATTPI